MLSLDGQSLEGMGHREAAELLAKAPSVVTFSVWREEGEKEGGREGDLFMMFLILMCLSFSPSY